MTEADGRLTGGLSVEGCLLPRSRPGVGRPEALAPKVGIGTSGRSSGRENGRPEGGVAPLGIRTTDLESRGSESDDFGPDLPVLSARDVRLARQRLARLWAPSDRIRACGVVPVGAKGGEGEGVGLVQLYRHEGGEAGTFAAVGGVVRCSNVAQCPSCAAKVGEERAKEIDAAIVAHIGSGGSCWLFTATVAGIEGESLADGTAAIERVWRRFWAARSGADYRARWGVLGQVRALEHTVRLDGSGHAHIHAVVFCSSAVDPVEFWGRSIPRWLAAAEAEGRSASAARGLEVAPIGLDEEGRSTFVGAYVAKGAAPWTPGHEMARQDTKRSRSDLSFAPHELFDYFAATGDLAAKGAYLAYCAAMKGRASCRWSSGTRAKLAAFAGGRSVAVELVDDDETERTETERARAEEKAAAEAKVEGGLLVVEMSGAAWSWFVSCGLQGLVLGFVERDDPGEVPALLRLVASAVGPPGLADGILDPVPLVA